MMDSETDPQSNQQSNQPPLPIELPIELLGNENRYRLEQQIGKGGMGEVFLATDTRLNKLVALKLLSPVLVNSPAARQRFQQECAICAALESPHIVQVSDYGITAAGHPFYVMEYLQGETLSQRLARYHYLTVEQTFSIVRQICAGLVVAHQGVILPDHGMPQRFKVIHRDLKPDNIFLIPTALGELVKIIDFGIAKIRALQSDAETTRSLLGTSHYAAPEQFETAELDERTDIYSLGIILYEMLTGTDPYGLGFSTRDRDHSISNTAWLTAHLTKTVLPLRTQTGCEQISPAIEAVVLRCLAKSPADRFTSVVTFTQALQLTVAETIPAAITLPDQSNYSDQTQDHPNPSIETSAPVHPLTKTRQFILPPALTQQAWLGLLAGLALGSLTLGGLSLFRPSLDAPPVSPAPADSQQRSVQTLVGHQAAVWALALSADNQTLISGDEAGVIKIWNLQTGQVERTITAGVGPVRSLSLTADGQRFAIAGNQIQVWNVQTGQLEATYPQTAWAVALSLDHRWLISGSEDRLVRVWEVNSGQLRSLPGHEAAVYTVALSPDQSLIASGGQDKTVKAWDIKSGTLLHSFTGHQDAIRSVAVSPQQRLIASGSWDHTVKLWNPETKTLLHTLSGHQDRLLAVAFSPDGRILGSASRDRTVKLWDVATGVELQTLTGHTDWVLAVGISADGRTIVSGSRDRTIRIWR